MNDDSGNSFELSLVGCKCIGAYVRNKKNQNQASKWSSYCCHLQFLFIQLTDIFYNISDMQICWIWQKVWSQDDRGFQWFLDSVEYNHKGISKYECVYGQGFVSTGGIGVY